MNIEGFSEARTKDTKTGPALIESPELGAGFVAAWETIKTASSSTPTSPAANLA